MLLMFDRGEPSAGVPTAETVFSLNCSALNRFATEVCSLGERIDKLSLILAFGNEYLNASFNYLSMNASGPEPVVSRLAFMAAIAELNSNLVLTDEILKDRLSRLFNGLLILA